MGHLSSRSLPGHRSGERAGQWSATRCRTSYRLPRDTLSLSTFVTWSILVAALVSTCKAQDDPSQHCRNAAVTQSCSQCIQNSQCAWCTDPAFTGDFRCDIAKNFQESCPPQYQYQDVSHAQVTENVPAGTYEPQYGKVRQIEPQQVHVLVRPGEAIAFQLKYYHAEVEEKDIYILNSDTEPNGVSLFYLMDCKGVHERGQLCRRVQNAETVNYNISVSIRDCSSNAVVSIGIAGLREVVALYVRPQCGCDCEKPERQEKQSGHCAEEGTLSCGVCHCDDPRKGGRRCECDLPDGISSAQLESRCREAPDKPLCSGHGYCACGMCVCEPSHLHTGKHCECGQVECPAINGVQCNGHGSCACGKCHCDAGWSGLNCECDERVGGCEHRGELIPVTPPPPTHSDEDGDKPADADDGEEATAEDSTPAPDIENEGSATSESASEAPQPPKAEQASDAQDSSALQLRTTCFRFVVFAISIAWLRNVVAL